VRFKHNVFTRMVKIPIAHAINVIEDVTNEHFQKDPVCTSWMDGQHGKNSLHYRGLAIDIRSWYWLYTSTQIREYAEKIRNGLGGEYFVLIEKDHIHIQYNGD